MKNKTKNNISIAYLGSSDLSSIVLADLLKVGFNITGLFCAPDKKSGRGKNLSSCPTKLVAAKHKIPVFQPKDKAELTEQMKDLNPDLAVIFAYGVIIPKEAFETPKYQTLNIHPSLLPKYRGPSPIITPILNGDTETGVCIIEIAEGMDVGPILAVEKETIKRKDTSVALGLRLANLSSKMIVELIPKWVDGEIKPQKQNEKNATYTKMIRKEDGHMDWSKKAMQIENQVCAFTPWPGSFTYWEKSKNKKLNIKIVQTKVAKNSNNKDLKTGEVFLNKKNNLSVKTGDGILIIKKLQLEGKKVLTSQEFLRGYKDLIGSILK